MPYLGASGLGSVGGRHVAAPNTPWLGSCAWRDAGLRAGGACVVELDTALGAPNWGKCCWPERRKASPPRSDSSGYFAS